MYGVTTSLENLLDVNGLKGAVLERCDAVVLLYDATCRSGCEMFVV